MSEVERGANQTVGPRSKSEDGRRVVCVERIEQSER